MLGLYQSPALYDLLVPPGPCEQFYCQLSRQTGGPVLELACGTGRLTVPLAQVGHQCFGLDASENMLRHARQKALAAGVAIDLIRADMADFDLGRRFNLIVLSCNSMAHLLTLPALTSCLRSVTRHLSDTGLFAFDVSNPRLKMLAKPAGLRVKRSLSSKTLRVRERATYDHGTRICESRLVIDDRNGTVHELESLYLRQLFPDESRQALNEAGLTLLARYGDFDRRTFTSKSRTQVCIAGRARL
jgi:SAM-dependent methyltransferase